MVLVSPASLRMKDEYSTHRSRVTDTGGITELRIPEEFDRRPYGTEENEGRREEKKEKQFCRINRTEGTNDAGTKASKCKKRR